MSCHTQSGYGVRWARAQYGYCHRESREFAPVDEHHVRIAAADQCPSATLRTIPAWLRSTWATGRPARVQRVQCADGGMLLAPQKLHSAQQIRTANFVLQSADPSGINAAGPGSNVGAAVVYRFAGAILRRAWDTPAIQNTWLLWKTKPSTFSRSTFATPTILPTAFSSSKMSSRPTGSN